MKMGTIKKIVTSFLGNGIEDFSFYKIDKYDVISFDMFDTLVLRNCEKPEDIFKLVENKCDIAFRINSYFAEKRVLAEKVARNCKRTEVCLDDIYDELQSFFEFDVEKLKSEEIATEMQYLIPNKEVVELFNYCKYKGKVVVITSDMYLSQEVLRRILDNCGICGYKKIYVSCEYGCTKHSGELFKRVLDDLKVDSAKMFHFGDHVISDFVMPYFLGIDAFLYKRDNRFLTLSKNGNVSKNFYANVIKSIINNISYKGELNYNVGVGVLGPILLGYCSWLYECANKAHVNNIVFLSREGFILKEAFNLLYENSDINTYYVNVSRLAVCRAFACYADCFDELVSTFNSLMHGVRDLNQLLKLISGEDSSRLIVSNKELEQLTVEEKKELFRKISETYRDYFITQNMLLKSYLLEHGFREERLIISDIGWSGTMQMFFQKLFPNITILGKYIAVSDDNPGEQYRLLDREGFYCNYWEWKSKGQVIRFTLTAMETLFINTEGTTLDYKRVGNEIIPRKDNRFDDCTFVKAINDLEKGAMFFMETCAALRIGKESEGITIEDYFDNYIRFVVMPTKDCISFFKQFTFISGINTISFFPKRSLLYYCFHPKDMINELEVNNSKILWLKDLFKLPIPYYSILVFLTKKMGMKSSYSKKYLVNNRKL